MTWRTTNFYLTLLQGHFMCWNVTQCYIISTSVLSIKNLIPFEEKETICFTDTFPPLNNINLLSHFEMESYIADTLHFDWIFRI